MSSGSPWNDLSASLDTLIKSADFQERLKSIVDGTIYKGFDPETIATTLKSYGIDSEDLAFLIVVYLTRGTTVTEICKTMTDVTLEARLTALIPKYKIVNTGAPGRKGPDVITLSRIASTFSAETLYIASKIDPGRLGVMGQISRKTAQLGISGCFQIYDKMDTITKPKLWKVSILMNSVATQILTKKSTSPKVGMAAVNSAQEYASIVHRSTIFTDALYTELAPSIKAMVTAVTDTDIQELLGMLNVEESQIPIAPTA